MSYKYFACVAAILIVPVVAFILVVVRRDRRRNAVMVKDAERVIQALYGSEDGQQGEWHDWRTRHRHPHPRPHYVRMAREHRRAPHRTVQDPHTVRPKNEPSTEVPDVPAPNQSDPQ